jgi:ubiquinone/menaquinone biosynthesis C-methylase UbiE
MRNRSLDAYRQRTVGAASGDVLEIGVGSGQNLPLYGSAVDRVYAIDPSMELLHMARNGIAEARLPVSLIRASAEQLPFAGAIFDTIIMTWTLCSIPNPVAALIEMRRVLKPGGNLVFVEHGLSPELRVARWQHLLDYVLEAHRRCRRPSCRDCPSSACRRSSPPLPGAGPSMMELEAWR